MLIGPPPKHHGYPLIMCCAFYHSIFPLLLGQKRQISLVASEAGVESFTKVSQSPHRFVSRRARVSVIKVTVQEPEHNSHEQSAKQSVHLSSLNKIYMSAWDGRWSGDGRRSPESGPDGLCPSPRLPRRRIDEFVERQEACHAERAARIAATRQKHREAWAEETRRKYDAPQVESSNIRGTQQTKREIRARRTAPTLSTKARYGDHASTPASLEPPSHRPAPSSPRNASRPPPPLHPPPPVPPTWRPEEYAEWRRSTSRVRRHLNAEAKAALLSRVYETPKARREEARREFERDPWKALRDESQQVKGLSQPGNEPIFKVLSEPQVRDCLERVHYEAGLRKLERHEMQQAQRKRAEEPVDPAAQQAAWWQDRWPHRPPAKITTVELRTYPRPNWV